MSDTLLLVVEKSNIIAALKLAIKICPRNMLTLKACERLNKPKPNEWSGKNLISLQKN